MTNRMFHLFLLVTSVFAILEVIFGDAIVRAGAESMRVAVFIVLGAITARAAIRSFWTGARNGAEQMAVAVFILSMMIAVHAIWIPAVKYLEMGDMLESPIIVTAIIVGISLAGLGYIVPISRYRSEGVADVASWTSVFVAGTLAGALVTFFLLTNVTFY